MFIKQVIVTAPFYSVLQITSSTFLPLYACGNQACKVNQSGRRLCLQTRNDNSGACKCRCILRQVGLMSAPLGVTAINCLCVGCSRKASRWVRCLFAHHPLWLQSNAAGLNVRYLPGGSCKTRLSQVCFYFMGFFVLFDA